MRGRWRTVARIGAFGALAVLLSACLKLDMDLQVSADDTVSGSVVFALDKGLLELTGQSAEDLLGTEAPVPTDVQGVSTEPYEDDEFQGQRFSFESVPLAQFNQGEEPDALQIVREGDVFRVSGALDLSGATGATGVPGLEDAFQNADLRIRISFPGEVTDANGQVDGNTVTWIPKIGERLEIQATASAIEGAGGGSSLTLILIIAGAVVVLAILVGVILARRRGGPTAPSEVTAPTGVEPTSPIGGEPGPPTPSAAPASGAMTPTTTPGRTDLTPPAPPPPVEPMVGPTEPESEQEEPPPAPPT
ncbi:MAG TPA: hypothetical protein VE669_02290 [Actinomycetota bacterium]|nr:hypothetical protein [Actinomycetota bacterium]